MIELTLEQRQAVARQGGGPARVLDPDTQTTYVLIQEETYERLKSALAAEDDAFVGHMYPNVMRVFGAEGWDDPSMGIYNDLDPRIVK